ncbi:type VII secretion target [Mycolicibacterium pulveris]|uniref:type VII secretion target n=1 Tax=Mycolicibacterium pulveris TaxID=36813 RepID=UPI003CED8569
MRADTDTIRALGSATDTHAAELADVAAALASLPPPNLGPVGARFLAALEQAAADGAHTLAALSERLASAGHTARSAAAAYDAADDGARARIEGV